MARSGGDVLRTLPTLMLATALCTPALGQTPSDAAVSGPRAVVGTGSSGGGGSGRTAQEVVFERAMELAQRSGRASPTVEQLLLALLDEDTVRAMLLGRFVDVVSVRAAVSQYVDAQPPIEPTADDPLGRDPNLSRALQRAMLKSVADNRHPLPTDLVTAILVEGDSFAAQTLAQHGLTANEAANAAVEQYLAIQKEHERRLAEVRKQIAAQSAEAGQHQASQLVIESSVGFSDGPVVAKSYTLRVGSAGPEPLRFKGAVSHDGALDLYVESTPYEVRFTARQVVALFEAVDRGSLKVELLTDIDGVERVVSSFGGEAGAIFEDLYDRARHQTGVLP